MDVLLEVFLCQNWDIVDDKSLDSTVLVLVSPEKLKCLLNGFELVSAKLLSVLKCFIVREDGLWIGVFLVDIFVLFPDLLLLLIQLFAC